jgi:hypothetical protein
LGCFEYNLLVAEAQPRNPRLADALAGRWRHPKRRQAMTWFEDLTG